MGGFLGISRVCPELSGARLVIGLAACRDAYMVVAFFPCALSWRPLGGLALPEKVLDGLSVDGSDGWRLCVCVSVGSQVPTGGRRR